MTTTPLWLASIDPGSSDKGWTIATCSSPKSQGVSVARIPPEKLAGTVSEVIERARVGRAWVCVDAPIRVFGGLQSPATFDPRGCFAEPSRWPFDVNPFSQRPCEHALTSKPAVQRKSLLATALVDAIASLCGWLPEYKARPNTNFAAQNSGTSVMGYMSAPHAPVVRTFLDHALRAAEEQGVRVDFAPPVASSDPGVGLTILESHPAVALAFRCAEGTAGFPDSVPQYKPLPAQRAGFEAMASAVSGHFSTAHGVTLPALRVDDELDAVVGLSLLLDLVAENCDIFGTVRDGFFLVPLRRGSARFGNLWQEASDAARRDGGLTPRCS